MLRNPVLYSDTYSKIIDNMNDEIELARERASQKMLAYLREQLMAFNLKNHIIKISAGMGSASLMIKDKRTNKEIHLHEFRTYEHDCFVINYLNYIEESFDWDWSAYLNDEVLN